MNPRKSEIAIETIRHRFALDGCDVRWKNAPHCHKHRAHALAGCLQGGYRWISVDHVLVPAHRIAWALHYGQWPNGPLDHINGTKTDNRIENLREATPSLNSENRRRAAKHSTTGVLGVFPSKRAAKPWAARISVGGKRYRLGAFDTIEAASKAYIDAKRNLHEGCTL